MMGEVFIRKSSLKGKRRIEFLYSPECSHRSALLNLRVLQDHKNSRLFVVPPSFPFQEFSVILLSTFLNFVLYITYSTFGPRIMGMKEGIKGVSCL